VGIIVMTAVGTGLRPTEESSRSNGATSTSARALSTSAAHTPRAPQGVLPRAGVGPGRQGRWVRRGEQGDEADLRLPPWLREDEPRRRRLALAPDGDIARHDRPHYGHLAPDAEIAELALVNSYDFGRGLAQQFAKCRKPGREPTPLSRHGFLGGRKAPAPLKSWGCRRGWSCRG